MAAISAMFIHRAMAKILSEFHFSSMFIDGACFRSPEALHDEFSFKLGLPEWYGRNWDALLDCLSSIGTNRGQPVFSLGLEQWQAAGLIDPRFRG